MTSNTQGIIRVLLQMNDICEISTKNWIDPYHVQKLLTTFIFFEKFSWGPLRTSSKNELGQKTILLIDQLFFGFFFSFQTF
jgi:hypothetical protein